MFSKVNQRQRTLTFLSGLIVSKKDTDDDF